MVPEHKEKENVQRVTWICQKEKEASLKGFPLVKYRIIRGSNMRIINYKSLNRKRIHDYIN